MSSKNLQRAVSVSSSEDSFSPSELLLEIIQGEDIMAVDTESKGSRKSEENKWQRISFPVLVIILEAIFIILFGFFVHYGPSSLSPDLAAQVEAAIANASHHGGHDDHAGHEDHEGHDDHAAESLHAEPETHPRYAMFQDVQVMIFVGFGFLMTFLRRYGLTSVSFNLFISAFVIQWATLVQGWLKGPILNPLTGRPQIFLTLENLILTDFAAAVVLISFGAVLGKLTIVQYTVMAVIEVVVMQVSEHICLHYLHATDVGGSMVIHAFGAYFGLGVARFIKTKEPGIGQVSLFKSSSYNSDIFSMIGTVFLWMFWPSFNSAICPTLAEQNRAVINTYFSLCACVITTFALTTVFGKGKLSMEMIQNATLAGGVAVGSSANLMMEPVGALIIGAFAGCLSVWGYHYLTPFIERFGMHDTCGVHNLHGMPGVLAAIASFILIAVATPEQYGDSFKSVFLVSSVDDIPKKVGLQAASLAVSLGVAIVCGSLTGLLLRSRIFYQLNEDDYYKDEVHFETPHDEDIEMLQQQLKANVDRIRYIEGITRAKRGRNNSVYSHKTRTSDNISLKEV